MILNYKDFINEKLNQNEVLDMYNYFIRILNIHEKFYYNDSKIAQDEKFRSDINKVFHKMMLGENIKTEELYNKISDYEKKLYNDSKIIPDNAYGNSMWDVCNVILEDPDTLNVNRYIQDFSEEDIYIDTELFPSDYNFDDIEEEEEDNKLEPYEQLINKAFKTAYETCNTEPEMAKINYKYFK